MDESNGLAVQHESPIAAYMRSDMVRARFAEVVGNHNAAAYIGSVLIAVTQSDELQKCSPQSIYASALRAATLRLSVDPSSKQAYLIPFKGKATLVVGYKGLYDMAIRTRKYRYLNVATIYEGQTVEEDQLRGLHSIGGHRTSDKPIGHLMYFELRDGYAKTFYMTVEEIHKHAAKYSKTYAFDNSTWKTEKEKMEKKTVLRLGLSRWGYLDPADVMVLGATDTEEDAPDFIEGEIAEPAGNLAEKSTDEILKELGAENPPISHNRTPSQPNENSTENKPVDSQPSRPYDPITLLARLREKSKGHNGRKASQEQRGLCVAMLEIALGGETQRKEWSKWALGVASSKDVADELVLSLLDWLKPTKDSGGAYAPDAMACREAQLSLTEALKASGQESLL